MVDKFRELAMEATQKCIEQASNHAYAFEDALAKAMYDSFMRIIAAHVLSGSDAVDVFNGLKSIYEGYQEESLLPSKDITDDDVDF